MNLPNRICRNGIFEGSECQKAHINPLIFFTGVDHKTIYINAEIAYYEGTLLWLLEIDVLERKNPQRGGLFIPKVVPGISAVARIVQLHHECIPGV